MGNVTVAYFYDDWIRERNLEDLKSDPVENTILQVEFCAWCEKMGYEPFLRSPDCR